jgi:hypothetical protein
LPTEYPWDVCPYLSTVVVTARLSPPGATIMIVKVQFGVADLPTCRSVQLNIGCTVYCGGDNNNRVVAGVITVAVAQ